jgi:hypothetical protein
MDPRIRIRTKISWIRNTGLIKVSLKVCHRQLRVANFELRLEAIHVSFQACTLSSRSNLA